MNLKKIIFLLLLTCFTLTSSYAQSSKKKSSDPSIAVSKEALANFVINRDGEEATTNFKIKFPGYPTILVKGNRLNDEALERLKSSKKGTYIQVFDIKDDSSKEKDAKKNSPLLFRLTTTP